MVPSETLEGALEDRRTPIDRTENGVPSTASVRRPSCPENVTRITEVEQRDAHAADVSCLAATDSPMRRSISSPPVTPAGLFREGINLR